MLTAISWCIEGGIISKMIRATQAVMRKAGFKGSYWVRPRNLGSQKLQPVHILPAIILCLSGLGIATFIFISEMILHRCRATAQTTRVPADGNVRPYRRNEEPKPMPVIES